MTCHCAIGLFNLRGSDIPYNPVFFSYGIITLKEARLYVDESQLSSEVAEHLCCGYDDGVRTFPYSSISSHLCELIEGEDGKIWVGTHSSQALCALVPKARRVKALSPIQLLKGVKNQTEIEGMKNAHVSEACDCSCQYNSVLYSRKLLRAKTFTHSVLISCYIVDPRWCCPV